MQLSIIVVERVLYETTSSTRNVFYETINSSKKGVLLMGQSVVIDGRTSLTVLGRMCYLRDHK
jgi:hypothetical protein